jgi:2-polyprenyl-6-methoxyphenol hydroxylase-like FAD-dependent oxidoreductase
VTQPVALIVGGGVAGLSAAWWLGTIGWRSVVVECARNLRSGGYMMSLSGPGYEAARRMNVLPYLEQLRHPHGESIYYDRRGRELLRLRHREFLKDFPYLVIRRSDLVNVLAERLPRDCELRLGTELASIELKGDGVNVTLTDGAALKADLLIGADGVNSKIRREWFAPDTEVLKPLGYRFAAYEVPDTLSLKADFLSYAHPGRISEFYRLSEGRMAALHVWSHGRKSPDPTLPFDELGGIFRDDHANVQNIIAAGANEERPPLVDNLTLVESPAWSKGRIVLVGDAAHCISLISGQGAGMAMTGAAVLAEELGRGQSLTAALNAYEARMRQPIGRLQARSRKIARWFVPHGFVGFYLRNFILRHMPQRMLANYLRRSLESEILASGLGHLSMEVRETG